MVGVLGPLTTVQIPVPVVIASAARFTVLAPQTLTEVKAIMAGDGGSLTKTETSSLELHAPLLIV